MEVDRSIQLTVPVVHFGNVDILPILLNSYCFRKEKVFLKLACANEEIWISGVQDPIAGISFPRLPQQGRFGLCKAPLLCGMLRPLPINKGPESD